MEQSKRRYEHDCDHCDFLGQYYDYDLYACVRECKMDTIIARKSSELSDYSSGLEFALHYGALEDWEVPSKYNYAYVYPLFEAFKRGISKGYRPADIYN